MRILVTNDDGITAPGIAALVHVAAQFGTVKVAAPDRERSACSHAMTLRDPLRAKQIDWCSNIQRHQWRSSAEQERVEAIEVNGVPVDCVNLGLKILWPDGCDLILSGINSGPNLGFDVTYSGTVAGAMEGCMNGIRSIAVSMASFVHEAPAHFDTGVQWLQDNMEMLLEVPIPHLTFLNVNVPAIAIPELNGERFVAMGKRVYEDRVEMRSDPTGRPYYWQGGTAVLQGSEPGTDVEAIRNGFVAITPVTLDWTNHETLTLLQETQRYSRAK